jgi:hypothetical protein
MLNKVLRKPCHEMENMIKYLDNMLAGNDVAIPNAKYPLHSHLLNSFEKLITNKKICQKLQKVF